MGRHEMKRSPHSLSLVLGRQLLWMAALLTLFFIACAAQEVPAQSEPAQSEPVQSDQVHSDPAQPDLVRSNSQTIIPASNPTDTQGIASANAAVEPTTVDPTNAVYPDRK